MTREEAIKGLKALRKEFSGYEPNEEMFDMAIKALEQEPCDDAISREPFTDSTICEGFSCDECSFNRKDKGGCILEERVMNLPSAKQEPKTGHWILDETDNSITCDKCGCLIWANDISNGEAYYCPNCGARMESEES